MGYSLWCGYSRCIRIKDSTPTAHSLCKYTWKVVVCMVLTGKRCLEPDIWPENPWISQEHGEYDKNNMGYEGKLSAKG